MMNRTLYSVLISYLIAHISYLSPAAGVKMCQTIDLAEGWNAVYVRVGPEEPAETLFANWPVKWVALYSPADYLATRQFSGSYDTEGTAKAGYRVWRRGDKWASSFNYVPANSVLVAYATNACSSVFCGTPQAPRITWHDSKAQGTMNLVGFSVAPGEDTLTDTYFSGLSVGDGPFYLFGGDEKAYPEIIPATMVGARHFRDGEVLLVDSRKSSDWSGVMNVSPATGLDFGKDYSKAMFEVRNDSETERTFMVQFQRGETAGVAEVPPEMPVIYVRDAAVAITNSTWHPIAEGGSFSANVTTGGTWQLEVAIDRSQLTGDEGGVFGAIAKFTDVTPPHLNAKNVIEGGSHMVAYAPISVTRGDPERETEWMRGLWVTMVDFDTVTYIGDDAKYAGSPKAKTHELPAGGKMRVRLPVYFAGSNGTGKDDIWLLQRFSYGRNTNGVLRIYSGAIKEADEPLTEMKRLSTPFLPTDQPEISFPFERTCYSNAIESVIAWSVTNIVDEVEEVSNVYEIVTNRVPYQVPLGQSFGVSAVADFTVGERSSVNPMLHAQHPGHDALDADFETPTPSGDVLRNYVTGVKPESFSITNHVTFVWDEGCATAWDPGQTLTGTLTWEFEGLRHEEAGQDGKLRARGRFTMKLLTREAVTGRYER